MKKSTALVFTLVGLVLVGIGSVVAALSQSIQACIGVIIIVFALFPLSIGLVWHGIIEEREKLLRHNPGLVVPAD